MIHIARGGWACVLSALESARISLNQSIKALGVCALAHQALRRSAAGTPRARTERCIANAQPRAQLPHPRGAVAPGCCAWQRSIAPTAPGPLAMATAANYEQTQVEPGTGQCARGRGIPLAASGFIRGGYHAAHAGCSAISRGSARPAAVHSLCTPHSPTAAPYYYTGASTLVSSSSRS